MTNKRGYRTFGEWDELGYRIRKGSKATWIDGHPMFSGDQVFMYGENYTIRTKYNDDPDEYLADCGVGYGVDFGDFDYY